MNRNLVGMTVQLSCFATGQTLKNAGCAFCTICRSRRKAVRSGLFLPRNGYPMSKTEKVWENRPEYLALNPAGDVPLLVEENGLSIPNAG